MPSLVAQLQEAALDRNVPVEDLLRRAKVVASKLDLHQFLSWIDREMKGYGRDDQVPEYRQLSGTVNAFNPYHGWREPIWAQDKASQELRRTMSNYKARLPVGEISDLINRHEKNSSSSTFAVPYGSIKVQGAFGEELANAQLEIDRARLAGILDAVRNTILEWGSRVGEVRDRGRGLYFLTAGEAASTRTGHNCQYQQRRKLFRGCGSGFRTICRSCASESPSGNFRPRSNSSIPTRV